MRDIISLCLRPGSYICVSKYVNALQLNWETGAFVTMQSAGQPAVSAEDIGDAILFRAGRPVAALVLFPGAKVAPERYAGLCERLVAETRGELLVVAARFYKNFPNPLQCKSRILIAVRLLADMGYADAAQRVFLAGHSFGGIMAPKHVHGMGLAGLILLASYPTTSRLQHASLADYAAPALVLGGERDAYTGINFIARESRLIAQLEKKERGLAAGKPVIVLRGINHMQFADGIALPGDFAPEQSLEDAHGVMCHTMICFMRAHGRFLSGDAGAARAFLEKSVLETRALLSPYLAAWDDTADYFLELQKQVAPLAAHVIHAATRLYCGKMNKYRFIFDKSSVKKTGRGAEVYAPIYFERRSRFIDASRNAYLSVEYAACKFRARDSVAAAAGEPAGGGVLNCAELNASIIKRALFLITDTAMKERLARRYGALAAWSYESASDELKHTVTYGPFTIVSHRTPSGGAWLSCPFSFCKSGDRWMIETAELQTPVDFSLQRYAGAHYHKLISPLRVIEWATLFGL